LPHEKGQKGKELPKYVVNGLLCLGANDKAQNLQSEIAPQESKRRAFWWGGKFGDSSPANLAGPLHSLKSAAITVVVRQ
jgi:hypothetical protein